MPTPRELEALRKAAREDPYFTVHEVVECLSSDDDDAGEEDLPVVARSSTLRKHLAEQRRLAGAPGASGGGRAERAARAAPRAESWQVAPPPRRRDFRVGSTSRADHFVYAWPRDLASGIDYVERLVGVRASMGGRHADDLGTHNACLALGSGCYLEILARTGDASARSWLGIDRVDATDEGGRLTAWAIAPADDAPISTSTSSSSGISSSSSDEAPMYPPAAADVLAADAAFAAMVAAHPTATVIDAPPAPPNPPTSGPVERFSRATTAGVALMWELRCGEFYGSPLPAGVETPLRDASGVGPTLRTDLPHGGLAPFEISWRGCPIAARPASTAAKGLTLENIKLVSADAAAASALHARLRALGAEEVEVCGGKDGTVPRIELKLRTPSGDLVVLT
jgi:hypothetical protein